MRSAFYLPGDPVSAAAPVVLPFLAEFRLVAIARESVGSPAESLFLDRFLSPGEMGRPYTVKSVFLSSGSHPMTRDTNVICFVSGSLKIMSINL